MKFLKIVTPKDLFLVFATLSNKITKIFTHTLLILTLTLFAVNHSYAKKTTWTGNVSTNWEEPANWDGTPPGPATSKLDIEIPGSPNGGRFPTLDTGTYLIKTLRIKSGATLVQTGGYLTLIKEMKIDKNPPGIYNQTGGTLQMKKNWGNEGIFNATGGTVRFSPSANDGYFDRGNNQFFNVNIDDKVRPNFDNMVGNKILVAGNFANNNPSFDLTSKVTFIFNGTGDQTIYSASASLPAMTTFGNLVIDKPSGTIQLLSDVAIENTFTEVNGTLELNGNILWVSGTPLPVELSSFSVSIVKNGIKLNWKTETEINNYGFEIEREIGIGQSAVGKWGMIGFVDGHGNSNSPKEYSFIDENVLSGAYSYRLKQIDNDGSYEFSKTIEINLDAPVGYELSQNYPNPFNPTTTIKFNLPESEVVKIVVYDILGAAVKTLVDGFKEAGIHTVNFDASEFTSGTYVYRIETNNYVDIKKMLLIK